MGKAQASAPVAATEVGKPKKEKKHKKEKRERKEKKDSKVLIVASSHIRHCDRMQDTGDLCWPQATRCTS